ncbi:hypothetical protein QBC34DRAFT_170268 [Podospora aff. communis PSN243]|uniref:Protein kinase domain-containing protein n=1 Tax=Podospora aff. communis PSN243 TaxID=3040156 RepID=A0AAV9G954_9PEZI|nr:hypothetical protein QBC34DRAFT_170268 [Podospora aff. communis PSN243]
MTDSQRKGTFKLQDRVTTTSLEAEEKYLKGDDKTMFLALLRNMLQWSPADKLSAKELRQDPWLQGVQPKVKAED